MKDLAKKTAFHATYKELKQITAQKPLSSWRTFHATYKELKHLLGFADCKVLTPFHATYKELKPGQGGRFMPYFLRFSRYL